MLSRSDWLLLAGCGSSQHSASTSSGTPTSTLTIEAVACRRLASRAAADGGAVNVYSADAAGDLSPVVRNDPALVYVPNSLEQHGRRDQPAHVQDRRAVPRRRAAAARHAVLRPADAVRRQRPRQQPHADQPAYRSARDGRSRSRTRTTCTSRPTAGSRSSSPSACSALDFRDPNTMRAASTRCRCPSAAASITWTSPPTAATRSPAASSPAG